MSRNMHLGLFASPTGHHIAAWRHPSTLPGAGLNLDHYIDLARTAERGHFAFLFLADSLAVRHGNVAAMTRSAQYLSQFEPLTLLSALSMATSQLGLVGTVTTTYSEPFTVARAFASLDHLSGGRVGWNLVTSGNPDEAFNFGRDEHVAHGARYDRAHEFASVVRGLWDSWDDDAFEWDRAAGQIFRPDGLHVLEHRGKHFAVRGPLNVARPPQGHPLIFQAGSSDDGRTLAAETADAIFTAQPNLEAGRAFYSDVKARVERAERNPEQVVIMPGVWPVIGDSEQAAREQFEELQEMIHPDLGLSQLKAFVGADFSGYPLDGPVPDLPVSPDVGGWEVRDALLRSAREDHLTIRQFYQRAVLRGHRIIYGTPEQIADQLEEWFTGGAADGFNVMPPTLPSGLDAFVDRVVPELRRRELVRDEYQGTTLRDHLGLPRVERSQALS